MQINTVGSTSNTSFGLVFDSDMKKIVRKSKKSLPYCGEEMISTWNKGVEEITKILSNEYSIYCKPVACIYNTAKGINIPKKYRAYSYEVYLKSPDSEAEYLTTLPCNILDIPSIEKILSKLRKHKE